MVNLRDANVSIHAICTGAGSGVLPALWSEPGASAWLSGCSFPYSQSETTDALGFTPESFCSEDTALDLACSAYMRAYQWKGKRPVGIGLTASVASEREHRGAHRCHVAVITDDFCAVHNAELVKDKGRIARLQDDEQCTEWAIFALQRALKHEGLDASRHALERFMLRPFFDGHGKRPPFTPTGCALMPGAFNPPHDGHAGIAREVERKHGLPVVFHVTTDPPHKSSLTVQELLKRAKLLRDNRVLFTRGDSLYIEKARRFPDTPIVMGSDALYRMLDPKWGPAIVPMLCEFSQLGTRFLVSRRGGVSVDDAFYRAGVDCEFRSLFTELDVSYHISSTELRRVAD